MSEYVAKPVVKNKFWIVEDHGQKIATIQAIEDGGYVFVHNEQRERYASIKVLSKQHNIVFDKSSKEKSVKSTEHTVYGYNCSSKAHNELFDVSRKLPVYTKTAKSRSFFCAGYYLVKFDSHWAKAFCPKLITLNRYEFRGPFKTTEEQQEQLRKINGS